MVKNLVLWLVIAAVLLTVFNNFNPQQKTEPMDYSQFIELVQSGQVKEVAIDGFHFDSAKSMYDAYVSDIYQFDQAYRLFNEHVLISLSIGSDMLRQLDEEIESIYTNWYLYELGLAWDYHLGHEQLLLRAINTTLADKQNQLNWSRSQLVHPGSKLNEQRQRLDELEIRLTHGWHYQRQQQQHRLQLLASQLQQSTPRHALERAQLQLATLSQQLHQKIQQQLKHQRQRLELHMQRLNTISPLATLERGYAVINQGSTVVVDAKQVDAGEKITAQLGRGSLECTVDKVNA